MSLPYLLAAATIKRPPHLPVRLWANTRNVWISLSERANKEGFAWPSIVRLMDDTGLGKWAVKQGLRTLQDLKWLQLQSSARSHRTRIWSLHPPNLEAKVDAKVVRDDVSIGVGDQPLKPVENSEKKSELGVGGQPPQIELGVGHQLNWGWSPVPQPVQEPVRNYVRGSRSECTGDLKDLGSGAPKARANQKPIKTNGKNANADQRYKLARDAPADGGFAVCAFITHRHLDTYGCAAKEVDIGALTELVKKTYASRVQQAIHPDVLRKAIDSAIATHERIH